MDNYKESSVTKMPIPTEIENYLQFCLQNKPQRGRKPDPDKMKQRLADLDRVLENSNLKAVSRLKIIQEKNSLQDKLRQIDETSQRKQKLEEDFIKSAKTFAEKNNVFDIRAWRSLGVPKDVLVRAGLAPGRTSDKD